jgi:hypothetical protein
MTSSNRRTRCRICKPMPQYRKRGNLNSHAFCQPHRDLGAAPVGRPRRFRSAKHAHHIGGMFEWRLTRWGAIEIVTLIVIPRVALAGDYDACSSCGIHTVFAVATGISEVTLPKPVVADCPYPSTSFPSMDRRIKCDAIFRILRRQILCQHTVASRKSSALVQYRR